MSPDNNNRDTGVFDDIIGHGSQENFLQFVAPAGSHDDGECALLDGRLNDGLTGVLGRNRKHGTVDL